MKNNIAELIAKAENGDATKAEVKVLTKTLNQAIKLLHEAHEIMEGEEFMDYIKERKATRWYEKTYTFLGKED